MLSISMPYNVILCKKKSKETLKKSKSLIFPSSEMTKNRQKNGSLNRELLNFLYRYGIFWMPPGEFSHPGGSEYVWQRGVEGVLG